MANPQAQTPLDHVIRDAAELAARVAEWQQSGYHVLSPATKVSTLADNYGVMVGTVLIKPATEDGEVYFDRALMQGDELALTRIGLQRIEQLAGLSWIPGSSRRTDGRAILNLWEYESWGAYLSFDGTPRTVKGTAEVDLREGSAQIGEWTREAWDALMAQHARNADPSKHAPTINGWSDKRLLQARRFGLRLAETKSQSACIRNAFGIKSKYTRKELTKPFIVLRVVYLPDMQDPEVRQMYAEAQLRGVSALYGGAFDGRRALPAPSPSMREEFDDAIDVTPIADTVLPTGGAEGSTWPPTTSATTSARTTPPAAADTSQTNTNSAAPAPSTAATAVTTKPSAAPTTKTTSADAPKDGRTSAVVDELNRRGVKPAGGSAAPGGAVTVTDFHEDPPREKTSGGTFVKAHITLSDGRRLSCVYGKFRDRFRAAHEQGTPIIVHTKSSTYGVEVDKIDDAGAPQDRALPGLDSEDFKL